MKTLHDRSRDAVKMYRSSGLNAIRVIVSECPASGEPKGRKEDDVVDVVVVVRRTTACSAVVDLQDVARREPEWEEATAKSCEVKWASRIIR